MSSLPRNILLLSFLSSLTACSNGWNPMGHNNVAALTKTQTDYFTKLEATLTSQKASFQQAMDLLASADAERRRHILDWQRDLVKTDILLQIPGDAKQKEELLLVKLAQLDLDSSAQMLTLRDLDAQRVKAVDDLYAQLIAACQKLKVNNKTITAYLNAPNGQFVAESIDIAGIVRVASAVRDLDGQLRGLTSRSDDQRKKDDAKLQKDLETAQGVIVTALGSNALK